MGGNCGGCKMNGVTVVWLSLVGAGMWGSLLMGLLVVMDTDVGCGGLWLWSEW